MFEQIVKSCKAANDYMPAWERFLNTAFFVSVIRHDSGAQTQDFRFVLNTNTPDGMPCVIVSEELHRLQNLHSFEAIKLSGGKLIEMLNPDVGILIALSEGGFGMPKNLIGWLRASIQPAA